MESDREKAKGAVQTSSEDDAELNSALNSAENFELQKRRDDHAHKQAMAKNDRGAVGAIFGSSATAASNMAGVTIVGGIVMVLVSMLMTANSQNPELWGDNVERGISLIIAALAYLFGKSSR